jgi:hypothetical protein
MAGGDKTIGIGSEYLSALPAGGGLLLHGRRHACAFKN